MAANKTILGSLFKVPIWALAQIFLFSRSSVGPWYVYVKKAPQVILIVITVWEVLLSENPVVEFLPSNWP